MRLTPIAFAVALMTATALSYPAHAYCRGCAMRPETAAAAAAAAAAGAAYGTTIMPGANAQAYEPPPMPDSSAVYRPAGATSPNAPCRNASRRSWGASSNGPAESSETCD